jgi:membrane-bound lytic murein transglycosylase A
MEKVGTPGRFLAPPLRLVLWRVTALAFGLLLAACAAPPPPPPAAPPKPVAPPAPVVVVPPAAATPVAPDVPTITTAVGKLVPVAWSELVDFDADPLDDVLKTFRFSCSYLGKQAVWVEPCARLRALAQNDTVGLRALLKTMQPYRAESPSGDATGPITGYYEPVLRGSRNLRNPYLYPLYSKPAELQVLDGKSSSGITRGRAVGGKTVPFFSREQMMSPEGQRVMAGREIVWVDDPMDVVLIEVQGSGRVMLPDGSALRLNYAEHNGHPFVPLGRWMAANTPLKNATITQIGQWARANSADKVLPMIHSNPQVVFFRSSPVTDVTVGPVGAAGVPLVPMRSIAVDVRSFPLAAPVWIEFKSPLSDVMYRRLVFAQDTGGAIKGPVRADYFWGFGQQAGEIAAKTRQNAGKMWVLLPKPK